MRSRLVLVVVVFVVLFVSIIGVREAAAKKPIQLSLLAPIQIFAESEPIVGFRFNLLYGRNVAVTGFDLGLVNHVTRGPFKGLQAGIVNIADGVVKGVQHGAVNLNNGYVEGLQAGVFNYSTQVKGVQLGFVNFAERIRGVQIGLVNIIRTGGFLPVMILVNGSF